MKKLMPLVITILIVLAIGSALGYAFYVFKYGESEEVLNYEKEMGLTGDECVIISDKQLLDIRGKNIDGQVYLELDVVKTRLNDRFYWGSEDQELLYTTATKTSRAVPGQSGYLSGTEQISVSYEPVKIIEEKVYVALDYIKIYTKMNVDTYSNPNRLVLTTNWNEQQQVVAKKANAIRYRGGIKSEILRTFETGEKFIVIERHDEWTNVVSEDGYIGWIANKYLEDPVSYKPDEPAFEEEVFTSLTRDHKIKLGWHQMNDEIGNRSLSKLLETAKGMNVISPTWFAFSSNSGDLKAIGSADYVKQANAQGVEVWALFSNEFSGEFSGTRLDTLLKSRSKREKIIDDLMSYALQYGVQGINLDFEMVLQEGEENYIQFVRELSVACRANNLVLSVDNYVPKYTRHYNHKEQGVFADYVIIMGYDEHYAGDSVAGPVASIGFVEEGISEMLAMVPKEKVINALPFYTRVWHEDIDGKLFADSMGMSDIATVLKDRELTPEYQDELGLNFVTYISTVNDHTYKIWIEDAKAVEEKMKVVQQYDLAGAAAWRLGLESGPEIWDIINRYLGD